MKKYDSIINTYNLYIFIFFIYLYRTIQKLRRMATEEYGILLNKRVDLPFSELIDCGKVAYVGKVDFAKGTWLGIILDKPVGKNNGVIQGKHISKQMTNVDCLFDHLHVN